MSPRVPIQIAVVNDTEYRKPVIIHLANDGSMWSRVMGKADFVRMPDLPQPEKTDGATK